MSQYSDCSEAYLDKNAEPIGEPQPSIHYRQSLAHFRHNVTTLPFDTLVAGIGDDAGRGERGT
jgi:hypothetical protein